MIIDNAGSFNKKIQIVSITYGKDSAGFPTETETVVIEPWAMVKTTKGFTMIVNGSDFEKAYTNFTIRYPLTPINRGMKIKYNNRRYDIEYINNINEANVLLEIQAKETMLENGSI